MLDEKIEIMFQQESETTKIIVDTHPPENLTDSVELTVKFRQGFWKDKNILGGIANRPSERNVIFSINSRRWIWIIAVVPEAGPNPASYELGAKLVQELRTT